MTRIIPPGFVRLADREPTDSDREYWVAIPLRGDRWHLIGAHWDDEIKGFLDLGELPKDVDLDLIWTEQFLMTREGAEELLGMASDRAGSGKTGGMTHLVRGPAIVTGKSGGTGTWTVGNGAGKITYCDGGKVRTVDIGNGCAGGKVDPIKNVGNGSDREYWVQPGPISYSVGGGNGCGGGTGTAKAPESNAWADHFYARNQGDGDDQTPQTQA